MDAASGSMLLAWLQKKKKWKGRRLLRLHLFCGVAVFLKRDEIERRKKKDGDNEMDNQSRASKFGSI
jgi:hypothetical protein